jgi:hypothetical protein
MHAAATAASDDQLPLCTDEDRWAKPGKVAVYKVGNKTASRVTHSIQSAVDWLVWKGLLAPDRAEATVATLRAEPSWKIQVGKDAYYLEHRPPSYPRCESYCAAAPVCRQWAAVCAEHGWEHPLNTQEAAE